MGQGIWDMGHGAWDMGQWTGPAAPKPTEEDPQLDGGEGGG